ncbi:hypothetical protein E2C01_062415 [Portunus trituberculatus]|uniref:Uncharacterized protein n=1 Tax=Portunus trituberculatus TaxID=210409 RepID=A0A5B7HEM1_PORTR|nr:hypothetical protein [Portunus trituberculatus]
MAPMSFISGENKESSETASVSEPQPSTSGFTGISPGDKLPDVFMDGDLSSLTSSSSLPFSPPLLHYPSPAFRNLSPLLFYIIHHQPSLTVSTNKNCKGNLH